MTPRHLWSDTEMVANMVAHAQRMMTACHCPTDVRCLHRRCYVASCNDPWVACHEHMTQFRAVWHTNLVCADHMAAVIRHIDRERRHGLRVTDWVIVHRDRTVIWLDQPVIPRQLTLLGSTP
jgi:hypothetical protein